MAKSNWWVLFLLLTYFSATAQVNRYVVFFKDKNGTPHSISNPSTFLSAKSLARRARSNVTIKEDDLPVSPTYVQQVKAAGVATFFTSRWMNAVLIEATAADLPVLEALPFVREVAYVAPGKKLSMGRTVKVKRRKDTSSAPATRLQLELVGVDKMHEDGFRGEGLMIGVFDSGFLDVNLSAPFQHLTQQNRIIDAVDFVNGSETVYDYDDHGTEVLSVMAAFSESVYTGVAYEANYALYVTEDVSSEYRVEEYNWLFAAERADSAGIDVINASLGYNTFDDPGMNYSKSQLDGQSAIVTLAATEAIERGIVVVCSAGNEGNNSWQLVTAPADAERILAVGSINSTLNKSSFSSIGPTADNRVKPDVVALGSGTAVIRASGAQGTASGTSLASPIIAGLAAGVWQAYPELTAAQVYDVIVASGDQFLNPDIFRGYGLPSYAIIKAEMEKVEYDDEIELYPNPVTGESITLAFKTIPEQPVLVTIYTTEGKQLIQSALVISKVNHPYEYRLDGLTAGLYLFRVVAGAQSKSIRVVKQ